GTIQEIKTQRVEASAVPGAVAVSLVSLVGGASLGPEDALGKMGGGLGTWYSERQKLGGGMRATNVVSGMSAAYRGLLASPILATILVLEVVPKPRVSRTRWSPASCLQQSPSPSTSQSPGRHSSASSRCPRTDTRTGICSRLCPSNSQRGPSRCSGRRH